ncbi:hypothetical protein FRC10_011373 [Ceratobasidium sp. 414]|nr:hypothetical protein FRC10_011373 [Ceratobasidium sp. 414]
MAHPELFDSISIGELPVRMPFVDGSLGCSNPTAHTLTEAQAVHPSGHLSCVISIGAGHASTIQIPKSRPFQRVLPTSVLAVMRSIATDSERVAQEMAMRFRQATDVYFRLNVDQGMQNIQTSEWEKLSKVAAHTVSYTSYPEASEKVDRAAKAIADRKASVAMCQADGGLQVCGTQQTPGAKLCPAPTPLFTGRGGLVEQVVTCISLGGTQRCVFVLHGLGGAGKTQIALKAIERTRDTWTDIIYADATSRDTIVKALCDFAKVKQIGDTYEDVVRWLSYRRERWVMVFDNADDMALRIHDFFPIGNHGSILITTRSPDLALHARGSNSESEVWGMDPQGAMDLLVKTARIEGGLSEAEYKAATQLLQGFGYLALAIVNAGAYIWHSRCTMSQYLDLLTKERERTLNNSSKIAANVNNYRSSVCTTWHVSYEQLSDKAKQLLWLMAHMHHDGIGEDMFRRAAVNVLAYKPIVPVSDSEAIVHAYVKVYLQWYLDSANSWDAGAFLDVIGELISYSLISYDRVNATYTLHVLVHDWIGTVIPHSRVTAVHHTMFLLAVSVGYGDTIEDYIYKQALEVHIHSVLERGVPPTANTADEFAEVYYRLGRWDRKEAMEIIAMAVKKQTLGGQHPDTLATMNSLAFTYHSQGRYEEAEALYSQVLDIGKRVLREHHPDTLTTMHCLALTYDRQGRYEEAESLFSQVLVIEKRVLGEQHHHTLATMHCLALIYNSLSRYEQAESLFSQVVDIRKRVLGEQHPNTLSTMHNIALTYYSRARFEDAGRFFSQVLDIRKRVLGERHPNTMITMHCLALTYDSQGRYEEAGKVNSQVLDIRKQVLGEQHPHTLMTMHNLGLTYYNQGQYREAETLLLQVLDISKRVLGQQHPRTLMTIHNLALVYNRLARCDEAEALISQVLVIQERALGEQHSDTLKTLHSLGLTFYGQARYEEAETLFSKVLDAQKRVLDEQHREMLTTMHSLASTHSKLGRYETAERLFLRVLNIRKRVLGEQHPDALTSMHSLALTYYGQARYEVAEELFSQVLDIRKRVLGGRHPDTLTTMHSLALTYYSQCRYEEAETFFLQVSEIGKQVLGPSHPHTLAAIQRLADVYQSLGRPRQSE